MGQRHQLYVIADIPRRRSKVPRYRCIAAVHYQWLYGRTALAACKAFLTLVRVKENAIVVRAELAAIASKYTDKQGLPEYSVPFTTWLILLAVTVRNDDRYISSAGIMDPNGGISGIDNNDGITVFDVTDPFFPTYCFVSIAGLEAAGEWDDVARCVPVSGETYLRAYYPDFSDYLDEYSEEDKKRFRDEELEVRKVIDSFKGEKLLKRWMFAEACLGEPYKAKLKETDARTEMPLTSAPGIHPPQPSVPSLSDISLRKAIAFADESGDIAGFEVATSLPGLGGKAILNVLAELDRFSDATFTILLISLSCDPDCEPGDLDLSHYSLTAKQAIEAIAHFPGTQVLNLNGNRLIDGETVLEFLPSIPKLSRLIVYDCPGISLPDIDRIYSTARCLHTIYHRALMSRSEELRRYEGSWRIESRPVSCAPRFTFAMTSYSSNGAITGCSTPWLSPRTIVVGLNDFHDHLKWTSLADSGRNAEAFFSSLPRAPDVPFKERGIGNIPDKATLSADGGWAYILKQSTVQDLSLRSDAEAFLWGFVRYKFARSQENNGAAGKEKKPALEEVEVMDLLEEVEVMDLHTWLKVVDPDQEVEQEWVTKLQERLASPYMSMITQEQAREFLVTEIPMFTGHH